MLDAGVPDGANGSLVYRPWGWLRFHAGGGTNLVSPGVRCGLSLMALGLSANVEAGHYFEGDANQLARKLSGDTSVDVPALRRVGYDYINLHGGLEWGSASWGTFYIHGGMSRISGVIHEAGASFSTDSTMVTFNGDPRVNAWAVSARLGFILYLFR
jgi:hypothetical protein